MCFFMDVSYLCVPLRTKPTRAWSADSPARRKATEADLEEELDVTVVWIELEQTRGIMGNISAYSQPFVSRRGVESQTVEDWSTVAPLCPSLDARVAYATSAHVF